MSEEQEDLARIYAARFSGSELYRIRVWKILIGSLFAKWLKPEAHILDLGCGHGEFINQVRAQAHWAMDLNPETAKHLAKHVRFCNQSCADLWPLPPNSLDVVFTSNFFEHLPNKDLLKKTLQQAYRALKKGGRLIALGPNIKKVSGAYWDFWDHHLPLTELSLAEAGRLCGFETEYSRAATLPYSMSQGFQPPLFALKIYLGLPWFWRFFGRQFLVVLRK